MKPKDEDLLIQLIQKGDREAFRFAYEQYHAMIYGLAYRYLKSAEMAEDAVQHIFVKLWEHHSVISITLNLRNYLYTMTKNYILNQIRDKQTEIVKNYQMAQEQQDHCDSFLESIERAELMSVFYKAIHLLPDKKRLVCLLKLEGKLSNQDIANNMNISIHTVKTHYAESIKLLRTYMNRILLVISIIVN